MPEGAPAAQTALRRIIQQPGVTTVIPGARNVAQARANAAAADLAPLPDATLAAVRELYDRRIRSQVQTAGDAGARDARPGPDELLR